MRDDPLDQRPGADRFDVDPLVLVELCLGHGARDPYCAPRVGIGD
jgi:hypothetical protein